MFFDSTPLQTNEKGVVNEFLQEFITRLYSIPNMNSVYSTETDQHFAWERKPLHTYVTKVGVVDQSYQMMRLFTLMYDVAVSRLDSTTFRRVAQHKIADHRNIRRYMRVIQCALIGQLIDFPECTAAGGMVFYPKDHRYIDQHSTKKRS